MQFNEPNRLTDEAMKYYFYMSNRENYDNMKHSIDDLMNARSNSVNEKCNLVQRAFREKMADNVAMYYYIAGKRGEKREVRLDRRLIEDKTGLLFH